MRRLNADEEALWSKVTATIRPLSRERKDPDYHPIAPSAPVKMPTAKLVRGRLPAPKAPEPARPVVRPIQHATLDGSWDRLIRSGRVEIDRVLDLHGHSLDRAWAAIDRMLEQAIGTGDRVILLVTGHERRGEPPIQRGKIRAVVNDWLAHSRHADSIAAVRGAHRRHGGGGSLYIILRRR
ncbi:Smr/MutS family protein [Sphingomonas jaspsi]|uniref:Smr/MutS family protein n=1 Tax=Sphingomonas jaspsi TaxID=392409 RepID=UPI0004B4A182|nr:Smr/MutS family protein [Sphingomonas jaspsi]